MSLPLTPQTQEMLINGPTGLPLECAHDRPAAPIKGIAIVGHPHPLHGGSMDNKVVHTIARALLNEGYWVWRFNFRGVGQSEGLWADGVGEQDDFMQVVQHVLSQPEATDLPLVFAGFSFGSYIAAQAAQRLTETGQQLQHLILTGLSTSLFQAPTVPENTLVIHGEADDVVELQSVLDWARPQKLPVVVIPGASHFFHGLLPLIKHQVVKHIRAGAAC